MMVKFQPTFLVWTGNGESSFVNRDPMYNRHFYLQHSQRNFPLKGGSKGGAPVHCHPISTVVALCILQDLCLECPGWSCLGRKAFTIMNKQGSHLVPTHLFSSTSTWASCPCGRSSHPKGCASHPSSWALYPIAMPSHPILSAVSCCLTGTVLLFFPHEISTATLRSFECFIPVCVVC